MFTKSSNNVSKSLLKNIGKKRLFGFYNADDPGLNTYLTIGTIIHPPCMLYLFLNELNNEEYKKNKLSYIGFVTGAFCTSILTIPLWSFTSGAGLFAVCMTKACEIIHSKIYL